MYNLSPDVRLSGASNVITPRQSSRIGVFRVRAEIQDEYEAIKKVFDQMDTNGDRQLTFDELYNFFQAHAQAQGKSFPKRVCEEIYNKLDRDRDQVVTIEEFTISYCEQKETFEKEIADIRKEISNDQVQLANVQKKKIVEQGRQNLNEHGIVPDSLLTINVIEAENVHTSGRRNLSASLSCQKQVAKTQVIPDTVNPEWNEVFSFQITTGQDPLKVEIFNNDTFEGHVVIDLDEIRDQKTHNRFFPLKQRNGKPWQGRVLLSLQWIWNKVEYYDSLSEQWNDAIDTKKREINQILGRLNTMREPFQLGSKAVEESLAQTSDVEMIPKNPMTKLASMMTQYDYISQEVEDHLSLHLLGGERVPWSKASYVVMIAYLVCSCLVMFFRPDYANVTMSAACLYFWVTKKHREMTWRTLTIGVAITFILDMIWLMIFFVDWEKGIKSPEDGIRRFVVFMSLINLMLKLPVVIVFWRSAIESRRQQAGPA